MAREVTATTESTADVAWPPPLGRVTSFTFAPDVSADEVAYRETHNQGLLEALDGVGVSGSLFGDVVCQLHRRLFSDPQSHAFWPRVRTRIRKLRYCADVIWVAEVERVAARMEAQDQP